MLDCIGKKCNLAVFQLAERCDSSMLTDWALFGACIDGMTVGWSVKFGTELY